MKETKSAIVGREPPSDVSVFLVCVSICPTFGLSEFHPSSSVDDGGDDQDVCTMDDKQ